MQISPVQRRLTPTCDAPTFHVSRRIPEGRPAFVLEHASPSAEPRPSTPSSVCPSRSARIEGGEEQKVPPSASKFRRLSRSAQLRQRERERERSLRPFPSHGRWTPKNFHFAFMQLSQSVRLFGYCSPTHSVGARAGAVLCGNFAPFCNRVSGTGKRLLPLPPLCKCWNNPGTHGATLPRSLARSLCKPNGIGPICAFASNSL